MCLIISLIVLDYPEVSSTIRYQDQAYSSFLSINRSDRVELICNISALPPAINIFWIKEKDGNTFKIHRKVASPNLVFYPVELGDEGNYTCNVTNTVGSSIGNSITLQVNESK